MPFQRGTGNINSFNDVVQGLQHNIQWCQQALRYLGGAQMQGGAAAGITQRGRRGRQAGATRSTGSTQRRGRRKTTQTQV